MILNSNKNRYEAILPIIADAILSKLLMSSNADMLETLDETSRDEEVGPTCRIDFFEF